KPTVTPRAEDRVLTMTQQILSRPRLERIIQDFDLYPRQRPVQPMANVVSTLRQNIDVQVVTSDLFRVAYVGDNARTVLRVTERLASSFIEENLRDREAQAEGTNQFLETQLEDLRRQVIDRERKLDAYRKQFFGELPSQLAANLQVIQNIQ